MALGYVLGIDPGLKGALALIDPSDLELLGYANMPTVKDPISQKNVVCPIKLSQWVSSYPPQMIEMAVIEDVASMPGQGVVSMFSFGKSYGMLLGVLSAFQIPIVKVKPAVWKGALGLTKDKLKSISKAQQVFKSDAQVFDKKNEGVAEAALIGFYAIKMIHSLRPGGK